MKDGISPSDFLAAEGIEEWRVVGDGCVAYWATGSFSAGARFVEAIGSLEGVDGHSPDIDLRSDGVTVRVVTATDDWFGPSQRDVELARRISALARERGLVSDPSTLQSVLVIPGAPGGTEILPFWQAALGYERRADSPEEDLVDPRGRGPAFWFEGMDEPRQGGGAIHVAVWVPYEEAQARVAAALAAGGHVVRDETAPSWWTLADAAGNEVDVATIRNRD